MVRDENLSRVVEGLLQHGFLIRRDGTGPAWRPRVTPVPKITRMIARIEDWNERCRKARGRTEPEHMLGEARKLFDEISNLLTELRRQLLDRGRQR
jgi:hypothetical protein